MAKTPLPTISERDLEAARRTGRSLRRNMYHESLSPEEAKRLFFETGRIVKEAETNDTKKCPNKIRCSYCTSDNCEADRGKV